MNSLADRNMMDGDEEQEDEIIHSVPVVLCNSHRHSSTLGPGQSSVTILDQPLRTPMRPYDLHGVKRVRIKPQARRLEIEVPMDTRSRNYAETIEDFKKMPSLTLRSQCVEPPTSLVLGRVENGKLLLLPVDLTLQMRPSLTHLDVGLSGKKPAVKAGAGQEEVAGGSSDEDDSDGEPMMRQVEVMVQRRETERQVAARLNSYAYISSKEEEEVWLNLPLDAQKSQKSLSTWKSYLDPGKEGEGRGQEDGIESVSKQSYLKSLIPSPAASAAEQEAPAPVVGLAKGAVIDMVIELKAQEKLYFVEAIRTLSKQSVTFNQHHVRQFLLDPVNASVKDVAAWPDRQLHELIASLDFIAFAQGRYININAGNPTSDSVRAVIIEVLKEKESFKKAEISKVIQDRGLNISQAASDKALKEICQSRGSLWILKA